MSDQSSLIPLQVHPSWEPFLNEEGYALLETIAPKILNGAPFTPPPEYMLRFLTLDLDAVKVLILGQDPYPQAGVATGRAFEVGPLKSWTAPFRNTSLRNIVRAVYDAEYGEKRTFREIVGRLNSIFEGVKLLPPDQLFKYWEQQGVLLLNTSFSCEVGKPGSHAALWRPFTTALMTYINHRNPDIYWLLWGNHAREAVRHMSPRNVLLSCHPMICHERADDFLYGHTNHFKATSALIDWSGIRQTKS
ncbi:uracil-DNA glycosylase [Geofilum rubicundum]|uniref:Uracil-DNA glycosylase n=1 Tax=Geofilum rubicundum JCM 15548 TaxID=1236989 RepID=A0A0E9M284_9BACT|nr:uracil-DNA glycosylase [Geofilum rubicundum]GAO31708.1 uracil-DNA glycosylase, family 1 [Geofilum rubicundum JCM 15548]